jgi:hypothetical protein
MGEGYGRLALEETFEKSCRPVGYTGYVVCCLAIEFEVELGFGPTVLPIPEALKVTPPQRPLCGLDAFNGDADAWCLAGNAGVLGDQFGGRDYAARYEAWPALVLTRKNENRVTLGDALTAVHRLLRDKLQGLCALVANFGFYHENHSMEYYPVVRYLPTLKGSGYEEVSIAAPPDQRVGVQLSS